MNTVLLYLGAFFTLAWGVAHLFPTRSVVKDFGDISLDNRRIVTMEWIAEGVCLIFIGLMVALVTAVAPEGPAARVVYWVCVAELAVMAGVSLFTGFRIDFLPYKLCPPIFLTAALLIALGVLL